MRIYKGENLRCLGMPLGGIGAGQISICGDGGLRQWEIVNFPNHLAHIPMSFFGIWVKKGDHSFARLLQSNALYEDDGFSPAPHITDHIVPEESKKLLQIVPGVKSIEFAGEYPIGHLYYQDPELPIDISLEAFSPFIPLSSMDSALPVIILRFHIKNNSPQTDNLVFSLLASLQNGVGWDGESKISGIECTRYGGNFNQLIKTQGLTTINMQQNSLPNTNARYGSMTLAALSEDATYCTQWQDIQEIWRHFTRNGTLPNKADSLPSPLGRTWNGAISVREELKSNQEKEIVFFISWHFPNRYVNWSQKYFGIDDIPEKFYLGNMYKNWFKNSLEVAESVNKNYEHLTESTFRFKDLFLASTIPPQVLECVLSNLSVITSPTMMWTEDGNLFGFEGCHGASTEKKIGGCCPMNCSHVWNYELSLAKLFPDLEQTMRNVELRTNMRKDGGIPFRTVLPLSLPVWTSQDPEIEVYAADGSCGAILKVYREYRQAGAKEFLDIYWPKVKLAMDYIQKRWDPDRDGVFDGAQWNTYDCNIYGKNSFTSGLYLAALRAGEEMAKIQGEEALAKTYRKIFESGTDIIDKELWNGEYYIQKYDALKYTKHQYGDGCHSDQLLGQWWAHILDLGYILPQAHIKRALESIYIYNFKKNFKEFKQQPRQFACDDESGLLVCSWPKGGRPGESPLHRGARDPIREVPTLYSDEIWTGVEYEVAALMFWQGMVREGVEIVGAARSRYDGRRRNPWNEIECGDHYARPLSSWSLLEALSGFCYDVSAGLLGFSPQFRPSNFKCFFVTAKGWGTFSQEIKGDEQIETINVAYGKVLLNRLRFFSPEKTATVSIQHTRQCKVQSAKCNTVVRDGLIDIELKETLCLERDETLQVRIKLLD